TASQSCGRWRRTSTSPAPAIQRGVRSMNSSRPARRSARVASVSMTRMRDSLMAAVFELLEDGQDFLDVGELADEIVGAGAHRVFAVLGVVEVAGDHHEGRGVLGLDQA